MEEFFNYISLSKDEEGELDLEFDPTDQSVHKLDLCLVGRFHTDRPYKTENMINRIASTWRPEKGISIKDVGSEVFIFQFFHVVDLNKILEGGPWFFENHLLIIKKLEPGEIPLSVPLFHVPFWIQIYDLPAGYITEKIGRQLGNFIGKFLSYDPKNNSAIWRSYMRIRVLVDVRLPLKRCKKVKRHDGSWSLIDFKYEDLKAFCFICGLLGHSDRHCSKLYTTCNEELKKEWGTWLCANSIQSMPRSENLFESGRVEKSSWNSTSVQRSPNHGTTKILVLLFGLINPLSFVIFQTLH